MRILVAESVGLCYGVKRALALVEELAEREGTRVVTVGPLCHNPQLVAALRARGVEAVDAAEGAALAGAVALIRSHGLPPQERAALRDAGAELHDGTCPYVRSAQTIARRMAGQGYAVLVVGDPAHPEVASILGHARETAVGPAPRATLERRAIEGLLAGARKVAVLAQTTESRARLGEAVLACLELGAVEVRAFDTTCEDTRRRREDAAQLARQAELTLVVGGRASANTRRLAELCATLCPRCEALESEQELDPSWLEGVEAVAVVGGASTPAASVAAIVERLRALDQARRERRTG